MQRFAFSKVNKNSQLIFNTLIANIKLKNKTKRTPKRFWSEKSYWGHSAVLYIEDMHACRIVQTTSFLHILSHYDDTYDRQNERL